MLVDIDIHVLSRLAQSSKELGDLFRKGSKEFPRIYAKYQQHQALILNLAQLVNDGQNKTTEGGRV